MGIFTANPTLNSFSKPKGITTKGLGVNSTKHSGIETDEAANNNGNTDNLDKKWVVNRLLMEIQENLNLMNLFLTKSSV